LRNVQGLRALAASLVVLHHIGTTDGIETHYLPGAGPIFGWLRNSGAAGVDLFFVISGFIMMTTSWRSFGATGASAKFFLRRVVRIYPPYWLVLIPLLAVYLIAPAHFTGFHPVHPDLVASFLLLPSLGGQLLFVAWTLVFEMYFYAVFAPLLLLRQRFVVPALGLWAIAEAVLFATCHNSANPYLAFLGEPLPFEFLFGCGVGLLYVKGALHAPFTLLAAGVAAFGAALLGSEFVPRDLVNLERVFLFGIPAALLVYAVVAVETKRGLAVPAALVAVGDASYAMYLWHSPLLSALGQQVARLHAHGLVAHVMLVAALLAAVVAFSLAVYRYAEQPLTRYLNGRLRDALPVGPSR